MNFYLEDIQVGDIWQSEPVHLTASEIKAFAELYDPQPMHMDEVAAEQSIFGGLVASGWHMAALAMKQFVLGRPYGDTPIVGLGVDELRWLMAVRAGDSIRVSREIVEVRPSTSGRKSGVVRTQVRLLNQDDTVVMRFITSTLVPTRS